MTLASSLPAVLGLLLALAACERERRPLQGVAPPEISTALAPAGPLYPGPLPHRSVELVAAASASGKRPMAMDHTYERNAWALSQGKRFYSWFNCNGCHGQGGGGMGPALMDADWRYGSDLASVADSIARGRPSGMPAFGGKLTHDQLMQLAAYVRALAGLVPMAAAPGRNDSMSVRDPEAMTPGQPQKVERPQ
jgi:cytochrome c oxidase cbb3-type subunit III